MSAITLAPRVTLLAPFMVYDGYGSVAEFLALGMSRTGATVDAVPTYLDPAGLSRELQRLIGDADPQPGVPVVSFGVPHPNAAAIRQASDLFVNTMWEADRLPASWTPMLNDTTAVIVPTRFVRDVCHASGVTAPVHVIPEGIDPATYTYIDRPDRDTLTTLVVGIVNERKHVNIAIDGWRRAFDGDPNARLIVKARWQVSTIDLDDPRITLIDEQRPTRGIADLYAQADILVAVGNEGFGLPAVEAMATGLPCIVLDSEGQHDTIEDAGPDCVLAVPPAAWQPADDTPYGPAGKRGVPDADDIADRLRWIATHLDQARHIGQRAADWALTERNIWTKGPRVLALAADSTREVTIDPDAYRDRLLHVTRGSYYYGSY